MDDPEFQHIKYMMRDFNKEVGPRLLLWEFSPLIRLFDYKMVKKQNNLMTGFVQLMTEKFTDHYKDYEPSVERDFSDALIAAKNEAVRDGKDSAPYLKDMNLAMTVFDMFFAGTDTSQLTFQWMLSLMGHYQGEED